MNRDKRISIALIIGIFAAAFLLSRQYFLRIDLTADKQFTMSQATRAILRGLDDAVEVKAYFTENLPSDFERIKTELQNLLIEYAQISRGKVHYRFLNPGADPTVEQEAMQQGIQPLLINVREKDEATQKKAFMGVVLEYGNQKEVIPFIGQQAGMEYDLTMAIKKISVTDKPVLGFVQDHGEAPFHMMQGIMQALSVVYHIEPVELASLPEIPARYRALVLVSPTDSIPPVQYERLDKYLAQGGKVLAAVNAVHGDLNTAQGTALEHNILNWLASHGIIIEPAFVIDAACARVTIQQQRSAFFSFASQVNFPYIPLISKFPDHPVTKGLEAVIMQFASPVRVDHAAQGVFFPLVTTSEKAGILHPPLLFDVQKSWTNADFPMSNIVLGGVMEGVAGNPEARLVVFSDADIFVSERGNFNQDNINLIANTLEWMSDKTGLAELRTKGVAYRPIKDMDEGSRTLTKYINFLLPIALVGAVGLWRSQRNRSKRLRRMEEKYV